MYSRNLGSQFQMDFPRETRTESIDSTLWPHNSKPLAEILTEINQNVLRMLRLIKVSEPDSTEKFLSLYQSLGECYNDLNQEFLKGLDIKLSSCSDINNVSDLESVAFRSGNLKPKNQSAFSLADIFRDELETALAELETEKTQVLELESKLLDSSTKIEFLENELEVCQECLGVSEAEVSKLTEMLNDCKTEKSKPQTDKGTTELLDSLRAELRSRETQIEQMEEYLNQVYITDDELIDNKNVAEEEEEELRGRVEELEKQVELQRNVISEREEEKREAIRELCFSLDHYKSSYTKLLRSISDNKKR